MKINSEDCQLIVVGIDLLLQGGALPILVCHPKLVEEMVSNPQEVHQNSAADIPSSSLWKLIVTVGAQKELCPLAAPHTMVIEASLQRLIERLDLVVQQKLQIKQISKPGAHVLEHLEGRWDDTAVENLMVPGIPGIIGQALDSILGLVLSKPILGKNGRRKSNITGIVVIM